MLSSIEWPAWFKATESVSTSDFAVSLMGLLSCASDSYFLSRNNYARHNFKNGDFWDKATAGHCESMNR